MRDPVDSHNQSRRARAEQYRRNATPRAPAEQREHLAMLGLNWPLTLTDARARYRGLARRYHPDRNNGDRQAEERLKDINISYTIVKAHLDV